MSVSEGLVENLKGINTLFDSHAHLDYVPAKALPGVIGRARDQGVDYIITVGDGADSIRKCLAISDKFENVFTAGGIHPHESSKAGEKELAELTGLLRDPAICAVGEAGLDFHYDNSPRSEQEKVFTAQIAIARELKKPLIIHSREASQKTLEILKAEGAFELTLIFHCYSGSYEFAASLLEQDCYFSAAGPLTYPKAESLRSVFARLPVERLLVETDSPYLSPVPYRGKTNEPAYVSETAKKLAEIRGEALEELAPVLLANTLRAFKLKPKETGKS